VPERLSAEQLRASLEISMAEHDGGPVWLFAYGSLIWRPEFSVAETRRARVHGYHRGLYLWSLTHRGTPEMPGLVLGLDRGGSCAGFAYRLPEEELDATPLRPLAARDALRLLPPGMAQLPPGRR
jgi:cation transport protein ChaC